MHRSIILQKQTKKLIEKEIRFVVSEVGVVGGELDKGSQKVQTFSYTIVSTRDAMYYVINLSHTAVCSM